MSRRPDGREDLARLELPLPLDLAVALMRAIAKTAERYGYTDVVIDTTSGHRMVATPPGPDWERPEDLDDDEDDD